MSAGAEFCLFVSNCHTSMNRDTQSGGYMLKTANAFTEADVS